MLPLITSEFDLSDVQAGLIATALFLAASVAMLLLGDAADRYPPKTALAVAMTLVLAGNVATALSSTYAQLLVAKAIGGLGGGVAFLAGIRYVQRRYGEGRPHFGQGLYGAGFPLGSAIGLWVMPPLALAYGWRGAFWVTSAAIALCLVAWLAASSMPRMARPGTVLDALRCRNCWGTTVQHAAGFGLVFAAATWVTTFLVRDFDLPLATSGILGSLLLVLAVLSRPLGGFLVAREHVGTLVVMRIAQATILVGVALVALPGRPLLAAMAGAAALGIGGGLPYAAVFTTAARSLPGASSAAQSLTALGGLLGTLIGAPAMGYAIQTWGFSWAWLILGVISTGALAVTFFMTGEEELAAQRERGSTSLPS